VGTSQDAGVPNHKHISPLLGNSNQQPTDAPYGYTDFEGPATRDVDNKYNGQQGTGSTYARSPWLTSEMWSTPGSTTTEGVSGTENNDPSSVAIDNDDNRPTNIYVDVWVFVGIKSILDSTI
jgi:hypothetical protein